MPLIENGMSASLNAGLSASSLELMIREDGKKIRFVPRITRRVLPRNLPKIYRETQTNKRLKANSAIRESTNNSSSVEVLNPWLSGGSLGSKEAVLVFRTSVLSENATNLINSDLVDLEQLSSSTSSAEDFGLVPHPSQPLLAASSRSKRSETYSSSPNLPLICAKNSGNQNMRRLVALDDLDPQQQTKENTSDNTAEPKSNFKISPKTSTPNRSDMPAALMNVQYRIINTESRLLRKILHSHGIRESEDEQLYNVLWSGNHLKPDVLRNLSSYQRVNHFPRSYELTRKDRLYKNIEQMQHLRGLKNFDIVPESYLLPLEYKDFVAAHNKYRGPWIVKPVASSRGRGIFIIHSPEQVPSDEQLLVAKYIANPLCIDGHKCDIRIYVLVTSFDPLIIYVYEEGLVRLATVKYNPSTEYLWNSCMHLCNYSINKYHSDYIKSMNADVEDVGHKWTLSALLRHLQSQGCDSDQLMLNIEDLIIKAIFSTTQSVASAARMFVPNVGNCFELFGFDILIDDALKPWLLEVNLSPSLGADSPLDVKVKASLLTDVLNIVGVPAVTPSTKGTLDGKSKRHSTGMTFGLGKRRVNSADFIQLPTQLNSQSNGPKKPIPTLSSEELKIVKAAKMQFERRAGFVRIFPTEGSMAKYGCYLDPMTGIPVSTPPSAGTQPCYMIIPRNNNAMLHNQLFGNQRSDSDAASRLEQYKRPLDIGHSLTSMEKFPLRNQDEARRLHRQVIRQVENGAELNQLQSRKLFQTFLEHLLRRLSAEPKLAHEKLILKFLQRSGTVPFKLPTFTLKSQISSKNNSKDRSALILKLLSDFIEHYFHETETIQEILGMNGNSNSNNNVRGSFISQKLFADFLSQASEQDVESVLTIHTNATQQMPFLYDRFAANAPIHSHPIPVGTDGFLKALPNMAPRQPLGNSRHNSNTTNTLSTMERKK